MLQNHYPDITKRVIGIEVTDLPVAAVFEKRLKYCI